MYEENGCFDPNAMMGDSFSENVGLSVENLPYRYSCGVEDAIITTTSVATAMEIIANPQQMSFYQMDNSYNHSNNFNTTNLVEEVNINNNDNHGSSQNLSFHQQLPYHTPTTPDLLNLLHLPRSPASPYRNSSVSIFENTNHNNSTWPQQPITNVYTMPQPSRNDFVFGDGDDMEGSGVAYPDGSNVGDFGNVGTNAGKKRGGKRTKQVNTTSTIDKQRRVELCGRFDALKNLIPSPTKSDRASVVGNAIEYIRELLRTVDALKSLVENKRHEKQRRMKRLKIQEGATEGELEDSFNEGLRCSWIQRKSKDTEVDVRIVDDEVTIKLLQRKKINCLVYASQVLDEFKLVLQHVASGHVGDFCSFFINSKISEGSTLYASAIASKLIEVMDTSLAAA